jgi:predicted RNA-binding protein with PIN domain
MYFLFSEIKRLDDMPDLHYNNMAGYTGGKMGRRKNPGTGSREHKIVPSENARIFIDAYNVICHDPVLSQQPGMEQSREHLRTICRQYLASHPGHIIYLVFDGDSSVGLVPEKSMNQMLNEKRGIREVFTQSGETADDWIIRLISRLFPPENLFVVTLDRELRDAVAAHGVQTILPDNFLVSPVAGANQPDRQRKSVPDAKSALGRAPEKDKEIPPDKARDIDRELGEFFADHLDTPLDF